MASTPNWLEDIDLSRETNTLYARRLTASIEKPIHNVKQPHTPETGWELWSSSLKKLVEPVGIEPTTSSLQS